MDETLGKARYGHVMPRPDNGGIPPEGLTGRHAGKA